MEKKTNILLYSIIIGIITYFADSFVYYLEFKGKYSLIEALFSEVPFLEMLSRLIVLTIVIIAGMLLNEMVKKQFLTGNALPSKTLNALNGQLNFNFLSSLAFQIRTPLNAIIGFSELLKLPNLPPESKEIYISHVNSSSKYLLLLINNLSEISRIDSNKLNILKTPCNINLLIEEIFPFFHSTKTELGKPGVSLVIETDKGNSNLILLTDPERLKHIFYNLLENALINTEAGIIKLGYSLKNNEFLEVSINHPGKGMSQERMESIFERYNKLTDNQNMPFDGSVLRLSISKSLVKLLGGEIRAESRPDHGTAIYFTIPYQKSTVQVKEKPETVKPATMNNSNWSGRLILIAEDVDSNFIFLEEILKSTKVKILRAKNGLEAIEKVKENPKIDVVLMDILMPEMDGYDASREIKKLRRDLPIVAQTACAIEGSYTSEQNINFDSFLTKPIWQPQLISTLSKYIY